MAKGAAFLAVGATMLALSAPTALANTWLLPSTSLSAVGQNSEAPQVAVAPSGETTVVWAQEVGSTLVIQVRTRPAGSSTFGAVENLAVARVGPGGTAGAPQVAVTPQGDTTVVWSSYLATNYAVEARTRPAGSDTFGPAETVVSTPNWGQIAGVQLAVAANGEATVVWTQRPSAGISVPPEVMARTRPAGRDDFDPSLAAQRISAAGDDTNNPRLAVAPSGETTVVWDLIVPNSSPPAENKVQARTRLAGSTTFGAIQDLSDTSNGGTAPGIAVAPSGETTVVWGLTVATPSPSKSYIQARTRPAGSTTFGGVENLSPTDQNVNPTTNGVAAAPDGATTVIWAQSVGADIVVQARTRPAGAATFGTTASLGQIDGQSAPEAAAAPDGAVTVVWARTAQSGPFDFVIQAATQPGRASTFGAAEDLSASGGVAPDRPLPRLAVAPNGAVTVVWDGSDLANNIVQAVSSTPTTYGLSVSLAGDGKGSVVSSPAGIDCGSACEATFNLGTRVSLAATATAGSTFTGWSGTECSGTGSCEVAMSEARSVTATFTADPPPPPPPGKPRLGLSIATPKTVKAGSRFPLKVKTHNASSAGASAQSLRSCALLPRGLSVVRRDSGTVKGRTICWTRSSLKPGRSVIYKVAVRSSRSRPGLATIRGTASASNGAGTTVRTTDSSRLVVVSPGNPRFTG